MIRNRRNKKRKIKRNIEKNRRAGSSQINKTILMGIVVRKKLKRNNNEKKKQVRKLKMKLVPILNLSNQNKNTKPKNII